MDGFLVSVDLIGGLLRLDGYAGSSGSVLALSRVARCKLGTRTCAANLGGVSSSARMSSCKSSLAGGRGGGF